MSERPVEVIARRQLDERLSEMRRVAPLFERPRRGWIATLRRALGMPQSRLATQLHVSRQAISQLEKRESNGSITLSALEQAAEALGGRLVYAVVPDQSLQETLSDRALQLASRITGSVRHTMRLEDQEPGSDLVRRTRDLAETLTENPSRLWSTIDE
jgi:predicted DNA-binding mobile mystery protein A